jgi:hypothetical protein
VYQSELDAGEKTEPSHKAEVPVFLEFCGVASKVNEPSLFADADQM